ncbi:MAG TPA: SAM-dependent methyltransferase [Actinomycetota bacterium]|jgi:SAM-dependent MidA family methyltransferase|nr:SAM-dependent methyltransferase [Actinomycetota bacterium]
MSSDVAERIRRRILADGPITFAEFMEEALYGRGGFYDATPIGSSGHFVTSPHVHPVFSRLVGAALEQIWVNLDRPIPLRVVEVGAGDGTMAREIVTGFERAAIEISYEAVEASTAAREALSAITPHVAGSIVEIEPLDPGLVVANELLDNLPFRRIRQRGGTPVEIRIAADGDGFVEVEQPVEDEQLNGLSLGDGEEAVIPTGALGFVDALGRTIQRGYALLIDYASTDTGTERVHGYRDHRVVADVLDAPGSADITAGVDLDAISRRARETGLVAFETVSQRDALTALGLADWLGEERRYQQEMLDSSSGDEAVRAWGSRSRAQLLADPAGLGRLRWLVIGTAGLAEPPWLSRARESGGSRSDPAV